MTTSTYTLPLRPPDTRRELANPDGADEIQRDEAELARLLDLHNKDLRELLGHRDAQTEAEKRALARELHDNLGSSLTAFNMHLSLLQHEMPPEPNLLKRLDQMKTLLLSITDATRRLQTSLRPEKLDVFGLKVALGEHVLEFSRRTGIVCKTSLPDDEFDFPESYQIALFRIVEEALENVARHACATEVEVILDDSEDGVMLTVRDNGAGMRPDCTDSHTTHGVRSIRERACYLGGSVKLGAGKNGRGTSVAISLPPHGGHRELA
ncbi:MAG TPA: sensor histidine kinase [Burkholderiaceae bacterium]